MVHRTAARKTSVDTLAKPVTRAPIWTEGRQRPKFDLLAWASVTHAIARNALVPAIEDAAGRLDLLGQRVSTGQLRVSALWAKRILPSHHSVGMTILALVRSLNVTKSLLVPTDPPGQPSYANVTRMPTPLSIAETAKLEPTLHAIRSALAAPAAGYALPKPVQPAPKPGWAQPIVARTLLAILMLFAWPGGAVRAMLYHLDGGDLRDWS